MVGYHLEAQINCLKGWGGTAYRPVFFIMFFKQYIFGDTAVYYVESPVEGHEGKTQTGLALYPADVIIDPARLFCDSLVQVAFTGDEGLIDYTFGQTMRNRAGTLLHAEEQTANEGGVVTRLSDGKGNFYTHHLEYNSATGVFTAWVRYENGTGQMRSLELLESLSLSGITAVSMEGRGTCGLKLHRMTSAWSRECRMKTDAFSELGMDMSWARYGVKVEKWGQLGSMSNRGWYPFAAVEDEEAGIVWAMQSEAPYSWQMELYQEKESCSLSAGRADYESGNWRKNIPAGAAFETDKVFLTVRRGSVLEACNALVHEQDLRLDLPESERDLPVLFNEYCTTWGCPSEENIRAILEAVRPLGLKYFVIDAGWYKPDDKGWCNATGDWKESASLFPHGIRAVADAIRAEGMIPGIWFEFEVAGRDSEVFRREDLLLKRDGALITCKNRRFFDLRKQEVRDYLSSRMADFLAENGFGYLKIDYNDTYGVGCDGAESLGEGGRSVAEESLAWLIRLRAAVPGIVIENCSSGGSRIEPKRMSMVSMCSFSDAHECAEIPFVAANVSRVIPARQMQIWAVLRDADSPTRTVYSLCAAMLGRICLSGDVLNMPPEKIALIREGLDFYRQVRDVVADGDIVGIDCDIDYYRAPYGRQIYQKQSGSRRLVVIHALAKPDAVEVGLEGYRLISAFTDCRYSFENGVLCLAAGGQAPRGITFGKGLYPLPGEDMNFCAGAFLFEKND